MTAALLGELERVAVLPEHTLLEVLELRRNTAPESDLVRERASLIKAVETASNPKHVLTKLLASSALTQAEVEEDLMAHRRDRATAESRLRDIEQELTREHAAPDVTAARQTLRWLRTAWLDLSVPERAEALRLLVARITYDPNATSHPECVVITKFGPGFVQQPALRLTEDVKSA